MRCSMALPSKLCAALHSLSNVASMGNCKPCRSLDLSVSVGIPTGDDSDHGTGQYQLKVNIISNRNKVMLIKGVHLNSHLADYVL